MEQGKSVCVYCSSSDAVDPIYFGVARELGTLMGKQGHSLVYGGGNVGLMGAVADSVLENGGQVVGVIPNYFVENGLAYDAAHELVVTVDMRERKATMEDRADAFVTLPGGFGTLEELAEMLTYKQLGFHQKPVVIVNTLGFYDDLVAFFERMFQDNFAKPDTRQIYHLAENAESALTYIENYQPPAVPRKWY